MSAGLMVLDKLTPDALSQMIAHPVVEEDVTGGAKQRQEQNADDCEADGFHRA